MLKHETLLLLKDKKKKGTGDSPNHIKRSRQLCWKSTLSGRKQQRETDRTNTQKTATMDKGRNKNATSGSNRN